jgi:hypothetical protein
MSHVAFTQGNRVDSWLFVVGSQTANLTTGFSFAHNLCFRCPNEQCEPISDIYTSIAFQWYKKLVEARSFDPCNHALKIRKSFRDSNSQIKTPTPNMGVHLGVWGFIPSHFMHSREHVKCSWVSLLVRNLVTPCIGLEPKARVVTTAKGCQCLLLVSSMLMGSHLPSTFTDIATPLF